jgi:hypothetical protein
VSAQSLYRTCIPAEAEPTLNSSSCYPLVNFTRPFCQNHGITLPNTYLRRPTIRIEVKSIFLLNTQINGDILCRVGALSSEEVSLGKIGRRWIYRGSLFSNHREDYSRKRRHGSQNTSFRLPSWVDAIVLF